MSISNVFLNFLDTLVIVNWNFQVEALQAQRSLPGVGVHHKYRQAGSESTFAQFKCARPFRSRQSAAGTDFYAVHGSQASGNQHIRTVCGSHQQRTGTEVLQHVRNAACAESDGFNAASIDVAFVDDGRIQVASHIDRTSSDQVKARAGQPAAGWILAASPDQHCLL